MEYGNNDPTDMGKWINYRQMTGEEEDEKRYTFIQCKDFYYN